KTHALLDHQARLGGQSLLLEHRQRRVEGTRDLRDHEQRRGHPAAILEPADRSLAHAGHASPLVLREPEELAHAEHAFAERTHPARPIDPVRLRLGPGHESRLSEYSTRIPTSPQAVPGMASAGLRLGPSHPYVGRRSVPEDGCRRSLCSRARSRAPPPPPVRGPPRWSWSRRISAAITT